MVFLYNPYIWALIASSAVTLSLGIYALIRRYGSRGAVSFILSMLVLTIWSLGNALEMSAIDFRTKLFWANMQYLAYCYSPVTLLILCMQFTGHDVWVRKRRILWISVLPAIIILLVWTDGLHGLIRYDMHMDYSGAFPVIAKKYGPVFYIHAIYSHVLNITAWALLARVIFFKNTVYRNQAVALFIGLNLIVIPNILYISGLGPVKRMDITPVCFGPAGFIAAWGIFRYKLFDLVPLARETLIETMYAGVMVLDLQNRIMDINPAFRKIIGLNTSLASTGKVDEVCGGLPELAKACMDRSTTHTEFTAGTAEAPQIYEVFLSPLTDKKGIPIGRLTVAYEITGKKLAQQAFMKQQWKLAVIEERERMARDMHDNLGQVLGFINLQAQGIKKELMNTGVETVVHKLDKLVDVAQGANNEMREYIRSVRNAAFTEKDFITALTRDISRFEEQTGICVKLDIPAGFTLYELETNIQLNMLNIVREALNNIRKHAEANNVRIAFSIAREQLCATIEDDGKGFDMDQHNNDGTSSKFGLNIMRERAAEIGGHIDIVSAAGKGSRIDFCVPIMKGEKDKDETNAGR
ncbi:MAG TPA: histidine kinase N-terminal 7TM domain-containing protein [Clostridia bacterium]|nr:histidine kinase N-terminal 7TM domain-containing protein [Clostridia bacterium]